MSLIKNLKFRTPDEFDMQFVTDHIEQFYMQRKRTGFRKKHNFSPSSLAWGSGQCPRFWYHAFTGAEWEDTIDPLSAAVMFYGTAEHERVQAIFESFPGFKETEHEIKTDDPPFHGFVDLLLEHEGELVVGEYKTSRQESFVHRQAKMQATDGHLLQVLLYMHYTEAKYAFVLYENKNTSELVCVPVTLTERNKERIKLALDWMDEVWKAWNETELPTRPFKRNSKVCKECPVRSTCWSGPEGELDIGKLPIIPQ